MNKSAIKSFAVNARIKLIEKILQKAYQIGIESADNILEIEMFEGGFKVKGRENAKVFKKYQIKQREELVEKVKEKGIEQVVEEVAYTWFNRFIAIRFMEVNEYLPTGVRVLSSNQEGRIEPDIISEALNIDVDIDREVVYRLQDKNDTEELFKYLLVKQCNKLNDILPKMFEKIEDYTELLLPDHLLQEGSVIRELVQSIEEEDFREEVEIIGWLYQYYISEKKDEVFAGLKKNKKITKENIPAATQLFTPKWIVKYMVENSLGRLWQESHPDEELKSNWKYYIDEAEQEPEVKAKLDELINKDLNPEEITFLDPAMGSGHILVYAFDVLYDIYLKAGYSEREIPKLILEKNIYGLDIDDRAGQLAYFALMMKARSKSRRIFRNTVNVNVCSIQESNGISKEVIDFLVNSKGMEKLNEEDVMYLVDTFEDAKEYGSILEVREIDFDVIEKRIDQIRDDVNLDLFEMQYRRIVIEKFVPVIEQAKIMRKKYDAVVTNPPYMGRKGMNPKLAKYLDDNYKDSKSDLFAVFMESCIRNIKGNGFHSMINQHSWMFLSSYEKLREKLILNIEIQSMIHLGPRAFEEIGGEVVQSTTFVIRNSSINNYKGQFVRVVDENTASGKEIKTLKAIENLNIDYKYTTSTKEFSKIPGSPIAYWVEKKLLNVYSRCKLIGELYPVKEGLNTGNNDLFMRYWFEVEISKLGKSKKWVPCNKGGGSRKWYGLNDYVINWEHDGFQIKSYKNSIIRNEKYYFQSGITWSGLSTSGFSGRYFPEGFIFNSAGRSMFPKEETKLILGLLNSSFANHIFRIIAPTLSFTVGNVSNIPVRIENKETNCAKRIEDIVDECLKLTMDDWNSDEVSWDFLINPVIGLRKKSLEKTLREYIDLCQLRRNRLASIENRLDKEVQSLYDIGMEFEECNFGHSINIPTIDKLIISIISYSVGCMLGRYSLDEEGLIYAGGEFDINRYSKFVPSESNVIPIVDDEYFEEDITNRFVEFMKATFGEETLNENLEYIAETLGMKSGEMPKDTIRRYFIKDFYKDHIKTYKKRPIYWLVDSGKQNGFKALTYMHRYDESTVARIRTDYLHVLQKKYESEMKRLELIIESDLEQREKTIAIKKLEKIRKQQRECMNYDQVIGHVANQRISIDLDDGVKVNYMKFQDIEIPQGEGKKPVKADLLSKIKL